MSIGTSAQSTGFASIAIGSNSDAIALESIALGDFADVAAAATRGIAIGTGADTDGVDAMSIGTGATAAFARSAAFGAGATTTLANQQVFGTSAETYVMPGLTSGESLSRQSGPLEVVTTDADGNLASDGGAMFKRIGENRAGVAIALATDAPTLLQHEKFVVTANWGSFGGENAIAGAMAVRLGRNLSVNGSVGAGGSEIGGRAGVRFGW